MRDGPSISGGIGDSLPTSVFLETYAPLRVHITGAPGAGKTTIGSMMANRLCVPHIDVDEFAWVDTATPYLTKLDESVRREKLFALLEANQSYVLSGSIHYWGNIFLSRFSLVVLLVASTDARIKRLIAREQMRHGARVDVGGDLHKVHVDFLAKARRYSYEDESVRSLARDLGWLSSLPCQALCVDGDQSIETIVDGLVDFAKLQAMGGRK